MEAILKFILSGAVLAVVYGQMCPSGCGTIEDTCKFGCACECGNNNVTFAACVVACETRIGGPLGCNALALPNRECNFTDYDSDAACAKVCKCCGIATANCSCQNAVSNAVFTDACSLD